MNHASRLQHLRDQLERPLLVTNLSNLRYLTGFTGSNGYLFVASDGATFVTDGRYGETAGRLVESLPDTDLVVYTDAALDHLAAVVDVAGEVDLEAGSVTWSFVRSLQDKARAVLTPSEGVVETLRRVKDEHELAALRDAAAAGDSAFTALESLLDGSGTEGDLGERLIDVMESAGGVRAGWPPIVARDANAALPHHRAGTTPLGDGVLLLDYGCTVDGYHSDMTRTVVVGAAPDAEFERVYESVLAANQAGIAAVRPGVEAADVDAVCRETLAGYGYEEHFIHSTGHGVGLDIHEAPSLRKGSRDVLAVGDVVTIEPGVYLPGRFGVRIEDMVAVTPDGGEVLTASHRRPAL